MADPQSFLTASALSASAAASAAAQGIPIIDQWRAIMFDRLLILVTLVGVGFLIYHASKVVLAVDEPPDIEVRKIRFAAATMTGILILLLFTALLYYLDDSKAEVGKEIFKNTLTALTPIVGVIVGYLFSKK